MVLPPRSIHRRGELTDAQWRRLQPLLPHQKPRIGRPSLDHRTVINGILWVLRTGAPIALRAFKKGETYPNAMANGKPYQAASTAGKSSNCGRTSWPRSSSKPMLEANSTGSCIMWTAVSSGRTSTPPGQKGGTRPHQSPHRY